MSMSLRLLAVSAAFAFTGAAFAAAPLSSMAAPTRTHTAQQQRMVDCNHQATGKKGTERKAFMSSCLKGHSKMAAAKPMEGTRSMKSTRMTQQQKMKSCNADAKSKAMKGADRKAFMSRCLKSSTGH